MNYTPRLNNKYQGQVTFQDTLLRGSETEQNSSPHTIKWHVFFLMSHHSPFGLLDKSLLSHTYEEEQEHTDPDKQGTDHTTRHIYLPL